MNYCYPQNPGNNLCTVQKLGSLSQPLSALCRCEQQWCMFGVKQGKAVQHRVEIGQRSDRAAQIKRGLTKGETVVLHPTEQIAAGTWVKLR